MSCVTVLVVSDCDVGNRGNECRATSLVTLVA